MPVLKPFEPGPIHEGLELSLYTVQRAPYPWLRLVNVVHEHWTLSYVLQGEVETSSCGETWLVKSGDVMLHPPHLPFSESAPGSGVHLWLMLDISIAPNIDLFRLHPVFPVVTIRNTSTYIHTFQALLQAWNDPTSYYRELLTSGLTTQLCTIVLENWRQAGGAPRPDALMTPQDRFTDVVAYMSQHLDQKLSREELAERAHLHPGSFDRLFRSTYGVAPMQMLRDLRLRRAIHLLETTDMTLSAVATSCGLTSAGYFSRVFREHYDQTPGQYRECAKSTTTRYIPPL